MKASLSCIIIDDEPLAQELIEKFVSRIPFLSLIAKIDNAIEAINRISSLKPDIIFLDIQMPEMTGIELLKCFGEYRPAVILISAHSEYALDGFEYNAVDYLLKPVAFGRFMKAIQKATSKLNFTPYDEEGKKEYISDFEENRKQSGQEKKSSESENRFFMVKTDKKLVKVNISEIVYVEGMKDYVKIHLKDKFIIAHITMTKIQEILPNMDFIRINRSFIVQLAYIKLLEGNMIEIQNGHKLTIGIRYRDSVKGIFKDWILG